MAKERGHHRKYEEAILNCAWCHRFFRISTNGNGGYCIYYHNYQFSIEIFGQRYNLQMP